jgi:hypothetical protein
MCVCVSHISWLFNDTVLIIDVLLPLNATTVMKVEFERLQNDVVAADFIIIIIYLFI